MKYINPGFPQLMDYQTLNILTSGTDKEKALTDTGYYLNVSVSNNEVLFKEIDSTNECHIAFDICFDNNSNKSIINQWTKLFDIYNDSETDNIDFPVNEEILTNFTSNIHAISIGYKQYKTYNFAMAIIVDGVVLGQPWYVASNELKSFEFYFKRGLLTTNGKKDNTTVIDVFNNNILIQSIIGEFIPSGIFNRINFYCNYYNDITIAISHIIYDDENSIGNERIKMLQTDIASATIPTNSKTAYTITEILDTELYSDIISLNLITNVNNNDRVDNTITESINISTGVKNYPSFNVPAKTSIYNTTTLTEDPRTKEKFKPQNIPNTTINISNVRADN